MSDPLASEAQLAALRRKLAESDDHQVHVPSPPPPQPSPQLPGSIFTVAEAAEFFDIKAATIRKWLQRGKLTSHGRDNHGHSLVDYYEVSRLTRPNNLDPVQVQVSMGQDGDDLYAAEAAATIFEVSPATVRGWASRGYKNDVGDTVKLRATGIDHRRQKVYLMRDLADAEKATRRRGGRVRPLPPHLRRILELVGDGADDLKAKLDGTPTWRWPEVLAEFEKGRQTKS